MAKSRAIKYARRLGAIGDSAVVEGLGLGASADIWGTRTVKGFQNVLPDDFEARSEALKIGAHYDFAEAAPKVGIPSGSLRILVRVRLSPLVSLTRPGSLSVLVAGSMSRP